MRKQVKSTGLCCLLAAGIELRGDVKLPALISDGMVVQQGMKAPIWGTADPGERITVSLNRQQTSAVTDGAGEWSLKLEPLPAGGPFTLTVSGKNTITLHDV